MVFLSQFFSLPPSPSLQSRQSPSYRPSLSCLLSSFPLQQKINNPPNKQIKRMNSRKTLTCSLFILPQDIFRVIFQYLSVYDLMKGEKAFLNNQELLSLYRSSLEGFTLKEKIRIDKDKREELISWIIDHKLFVETLDLYLRDLEMNLLDHSRSYLKEITFHSPDSDPVNPQLGHFPSLISVTFWGSNYFAKAKLLSFFSHNPQLDSVSLEQMQHLTNEIIPHLSNSCPNIKILSLNWNNWVNDQTISLMTQQRLFPQLKSLHIAGTGVRNQEPIRQFILSHPHLSGLSLPFDIPYSTEFLLFYLRQVIFPSILNQNNNYDLESHSLALSSLFDCFVVDKRDDILTPEIFSVDILSRLYRKGCSLDTLDKTAEFFYRLSEYPSMIYSILQSQFIPFIINYMSTDGFLAIAPVVDLLFRCGVFHDYFPLFVEKYRTYPPPLIEIFHQAVENHFISLKKQELQTIIPIVLNKLHVIDSSSNCLEIISKLLQKLTSRNLIDPNSLLSSFKSINYVSESTDVGGVFDCLKSFLSVNENYQQLLIESNLIPQIMRLVNTHYLIHFTTRCLSSRYDLLVGHLTNSGMFQYLVSKYFQFTVQNKNKMKTLIKLLIESNNNKYSEIVNGLELPDELKSKLHEKEMTKKRSNKVKK